MKKTGFILVLGVIFLGMVGSVYAITRYDEETMEIKSMHYVVRYGIVVSAKKANTIIIFYKEILFGSVIGALIIVHIEI